MKTRRLVALLFALGFLISAPALILYTAGYRYNIKKQELNKYGTLVIESTPRNANITLNNDKETFHTPLRKDNLFPNNYLITVSKEGYYTWQKRLAVYPQQTTFAENIILFENNQPELLLNQSVKQVFIAPDKNHILLTYENAGQEFLASFNWSSEQLSNIEVMSFGEISEVKWSAASESALVTFTKDSTHATYLYDIKGLKRLKRVADSSKWDAQNSNIIYYLQNNIVSIEKIREKSISTLYAFKNGTDIRDFHVNGSQLYFINQTTDKQTLNYLDLADNNAERLHKIDLGRDQFSIQDFTGNHLVIKNMINSHLVFVNSNLDNILFEEPEVLGYKLNARENLMLIYDSSEISLANLNSSPIKFSTSVRVTNGITWADWYSEPNYLVYLENQTLKIIELDDRDNRNTITLPTGSTNFATLNKSGTEIIFTKSDEPGLFTIKISE